MTADNQANQDYQHASTVEVDGIEIFSTPCDFGNLPGSYQQPTGSLQGGLSIKDTALVLGISKNTVRARIKSGELPAGKVKGPTGEQWRVFTGNLPTDYQQVTNTLPASSQSGSSSEVQRLLNIVEKQASRLEVASGQIGYLQAQLQATQEHVKLLTDSQHKCGRWSRFWSWFTGR